jgi:hypothetical protein
MSHTPLHLVILGASGDLTARKLIPSLYRLWIKKRLPEHLKVVGVSRTPLGVDGFRDRMAEDFFAGLAVTLGCSLGPAMGGTSQVYVKPQIFFGSERPSNWGIEIGYKLLGF